jgi:hypothetical protein
VLVPFFTPSRTPLLDSRWVPPISSNPPAILDDRQVPSTSLRNAQYAGRLGTTIGGWDVSISYFDGFERTPVLKRLGVDSTPVDPLPRYVPVFTRINAPGADFSTTFGSFEIHGEGALRLMERDGKNDIFQAILGVNYRLQTPVSWLTEVSLLLEYAKEIVVRVDPESPIVGSSRLFDIGVPVVDSISGADNSPDDALVWQAVFRRNEQTQVQLRGSANFTPVLNHLVELKVTHTFNDFLQVEAGLDLFTGQPDTFWGRWRENDRIFVSTRYLF